MMAFLGNPAFSNVAKVYGKKEPNNE